MSSRTLSMTDSIHAYLMNVGVREHEALVALRHATASHEWAVMQISPEQGQLMSMLVRLMGAKRCIEVGTFTGYSALATALAMPEDGELIACDVSEEWTAVGVPFWEQAGVAHKIDLRIAPALETLDALLESGEAGRFDFAFLDADKANYDAYYERLLTLLRPGGCLGVDNVLWGGRLAAPAAPDEDASTQALRALNAKIQEDARVDVTMIPVGDGLTLVRKRGGEA